ncbi:hypothetical protein BDR06DRAFT_733653 [Suillus hirtellus]|nr:hypothetical protein BDR06DRAFT_733653 [Suillus hirtellus]
MRKTANSHFPAPTSPTYSPACEYSHPIVFLHLLIPNSITQHLHIVRFFIRLLNLAVVNLFLAPASPAYSPTSPQWSPSSPAQNGRSHSYSTSPSWE